MSLGISKAEDKNVKLNIPFFPPFTLEFALSWLKFLNFWYLTIFMPESCINEE